MSSVEVGGEKTQRGQEVEGSWWGRGIRAQPLLLLLFEVGQCRGLLILRSRTKVCGDSDGTGVGTEGLACW